jgi:phage-related protein
MARLQAPGEKPLYWVASSKRDLLNFPEAVRDALGTALSVAQFGGKHPAACWRLLRIFRVIRTVPCTQFDSRGLYVLHAFQKKSPKGIRTARHDVDLILQRLKAAERDYVESYGKDEN